MSLSWHIWADIALFSRTQSTLVATDAESAIENTDGKQICSITSTPSHCQMVMPFIPDLTVWPTYACLFHVPSTASIAYYPTLSNRPHLRNKGTMILWLKHWTGAQEVWAQFPGLPPIPCMMWSKTFKLSVPQLPLYKMGIIILLFSHSSTLLSV